MSRNNGTRKPRKTAADTEERQVKAQSLRDRLAQWEADADESMIAEALARFDGYHGKNPLLIALQCPHATDVDGLAAWKTRGRVPVDMEDCILIYKPITRPRGDAKKNDAEKKEGENERVRCFLGPVFDVSQTVEARCLDCGEHVAKDGYGRFAPWLVIGDGPKDVRAKCTSVTGRHRMTPNDSDA